MTNQIKQLFLFIVCILLFFIPAQNSVIGQQATNGKIARRHLVALAETIGARVAGTSDEVKAAQYIETAFKVFDYSVELQSFSYTEEEGDGTAYNSANVIAVKPGLSTREIVVGAHYDSVDTAKGADDNASGVAVMLEVAEKIKNIQTPYTIRFIAFGAEEVGLFGSKYYIDQLSSEAIKNTVGMINLDGLIAGDLFYIYSGTGKTAVIQDWIVKQAQRSGFDLNDEVLDTIDEMTCECSDYAPFNSVKIPYAFFEATNATKGAKDGDTQVDPKFGDEGKIRHTAYDTISYIDQTFPGRIGAHLDLFVTIVTDTLTQFEAQ